MILSSELQTTREESLTRKFSTVSVGEVMGVESADLGLLIARLYTSSATELSMISKVLPITAKAQRRLASG